MSLTLLVHDQRPVVIIRWFLDSNGLVLFASGPFVEMPLEEFRLTGHQWVNRHFQEYAKTRLPRNKLVKVFQPGEAAKFMRNRRVLEIHIDPNRNLIFSPMLVEKYDLGDLRRVSKQSERTIPADASSEVFWKTFDEVLAMARESE